MDKIQIISIITLILSFAVFFSLLFFMTNTNLHKEKK